MDRWLADTSARYVDRLRDLARRLDTAIRRQADGVPAEHWPPGADPSRWLRPLLLDLRAACDQAGEAGDAIFLAAVRVRDDVSKVVADYRGSGSVESWASCRDRVLDDLETISAAAGASPSPEVLRAAHPQAPAGPAVEYQDRGEKRHKGGKPPGRRRPGSGRPNGRPSKDADDLLEKVIRQITNEACREDLNVEREIWERVYRRTAEDLCELIFERLRKRIAPSTLRSSSQLWKKWGTFRKANGKPAPDALTDVPAEPGSIHVGGTRRSADERRQDAAIARWEAEAGVSLDDD